MYDPPYNGSDKADAVRPIGYDKASAIAHHALDHNQTLKEAALESGFIDEQQFDLVVDPRKMV